jgi:GNAT superfamily N-acetyltransferase
MSENLRIVPVHSRAEQRAFVELAWQLYADDPNWMPPLRMNLREMLNYKPHPYYTRNKIQTFLAMRGNQVVGRIAAMTNVDHNERYKEHRGFFGFYESTEDSAVAKALFDAARGWLREQGLTDLRGPLQPSMNHEVGLLVEGYDTPPYFMMTYNKPFYERLFLENGLVKTQDLYAFWGHINMLGGLDKKLQYIVDTARERFNIVVRPLDKKHFNRDIEYFIEIYNRSLSKTWGFVPYTKAEGEHLAVGLKRLLVPELTLFAEIDGKPIGFCAALLDYNPRIKAINGRLFPFGFIKLLWNRRKIKKMRVISANVIPEYQSWGVGLVLLNGLVPKFLNWGLEEAEFSWVLESNHLSRASLEKGGAKLSKTYRLYDGKIDATGPAS